MSLIYQPWALQKDVFCCLIWMRTMSAQWWVLWVQLVQVVVEFVVSCSKLEYCALVSAVWLAYVVLGVWFDHF